ncbi:hypothetical protein [Enterococcus rivorum]|uniref:Uncharacterized protein n=1 Tax=Enterococcus rivorum TaxID=762845 RepID=A0A1E5KSM9_9ENTE|nr:hypothetical protein [Enterococcus rivorum]MBP2098213.1 hypothetical protein [Enterococcus rivorum]OEH80866.1 hypothetical protein BCR26_06445 [Enterococcus rivorum]
MSQKFMNYVGEVLSDVDYHALGKPENFLEVKMDAELPFRLYFRTHENDWETVTEEERLELIQKLKDKKSKYSRSDHRYYSIDFYLASLGADYKSIRNESV